MPGPLEILESQAAATGRIIQSVPNADFAKDSPGCPGWQVQDVVAHLTASAEMFAAIARGTLSGVNWEQERSRLINENRSLPPAELKNRYADRDTKLLETYKSLTPEELQSMRQHPVIGELPVAQFIGMRISELTVHGWDVQAAIDPDAKLEAPALPAALPPLVAQWPRWFLPEKIGGMSRAYRFKIGEPMNHDHTLRIADGKAAWAEDGTPGDSTLTIDAGDFLLLVSGRRSSEGLVASGRTKVDGDPGAAEELSTLFKAYAGR